MTEEDPRPAELSRRLDEFGTRMDQSFRDMNLRLDRMPTNDILLAYLATRDQEMKTLGESVKSVTASLAKETAERQADVQAERTAREKQAKDDRDRAEATRRWALGFGVTLMVALIGVATFVINLAGGAT